MAFTENLAPFFADFAVVATLNGASVSGIFDTGTQLGNVAAMGIASVQPTLMLPRDRVAADPVGQTCVVNSINYRVAMHEHDGMVSTLYLERA